MVVRVDLDVRHEGSIRVRRRSRSRGSRREIPCPRPLTAEEMKPSDQAHTTAILRISSWVSLFPASRTRLWLVDKWEHRHRRPSREPGNLHTTCGQRLRRPSFCAPWRSANVLAPQSRLFPPNPCDPAISETPPLPKRPSPVSQAGMYAG